MVCLLLYGCPCVNLTGTCVFRGVFVGLKPCWSSVLRGGVWSCTRACAIEASCRSLMALWELLLLTFSLHCWLTGYASIAEEGPAGPLDWLLSDKGPFHHSQEYTDFVERNRQGFSTRYKIYRWVLTEKGNSGFYALIWSARFHPSILWIMTKITFWREIRTFNETVLWFKEWVSKCTHKIYVI